MRDAETLFSVDDHQTESRSQRPSKHPMRADDYVDFAGLDAFTTSSAPSMNGIVRATQSSPKGREPLAKSVEVLICEDVVGVRTAACFPSITAWNAARIATSVAVPNVSTQQTIHWRRRLHVALHVSMAVPDRA